MVLSHPEARSPGGQILISIQLSVTFPGQPEEPHRVVTVHTVYNSSMLDRISTP